MGPCTVPKLRVGPASYNTQLWVFSAHITPTKKAPPNGRAFFRSVGMTYCIINRWV